MSVVTVSDFAATGPATPRIAARPAETGVLQDVGAFMRRRFVAVFGTMLLVFAVAVVVVRLVPPRFAARADVLLDPRRDKAFGPDDLAGAVNLDTAAIEGAQALIKGNGVLLRVVRAERLASDPAFNGAEVPVAPAWRAVAALLGHREPQASSPEQHAVGALFRALKVERIGKAFVLSITVTVRAPDLAARLANAVADGFVQDQRQARLEASRREAAFFAERLGPLGDRLRRSEDSLDRFRRDHDLTATAAHGQETDRPASLNEQQLAELNTRLAAARAESAQAWAHYDAARAIVAGGRGMETIPDVVRSTLVAQLRQQAAEVARKEADLSARYSDGHPALINARAERREIERAIAREMARIVANLKGTYDIAKSQEDGLRANVALTTGAAGLDSDLGRQLRELERLKLVDQTVFETYLARARAAEQKSTFEEHDVRVISPASAPVVPAFPQTRLTLFCALLLGAGAGIAVGRARDALDTRYTSVSQLETDLGAPVLATLPRLGVAECIVDGKRFEPSRLLARRPHGRFGETIHALRAGLGAAPPASVILVTSVAARQGRTTLALSLALSAAMARQRVLILDADLRQPALSRSFGLENRLGLVDVLAGLVGTAETTVPLGPGLAIMPAGRGAAVGADLFTSHRMARYLDHLRQVYDLVVIDTGPTDGTADARTLSRLCDRVVLLIGWPDTCRAAAARAVSGLAPGRLAGIVLNEAGSRRPLRRAAGRRGPVESDA